MNVRERIALPVSPINSFTAADTANGNYHTGCRFWRSGSMQIVFRLMASRTIAGDIITGNIHVNVITEHVTM